MSNYISVFLILLTLNTSAQQKVGLVLSGGAASGLAHVGVLKALEENHIPIDYITGTSMGAVIGGLYACGYSPQQIEAMVTSDRFIKMSKGEYERHYNYFYNEKRENASWITVKLSKDTALTASLPTNLISPIATDFELLELMSSASAAANYNFDSLFVPFRCVASDIESKKEVVFESGHLNQAIRASMSYPFYLRPITVDGKILFDGGLYNNFPSDIMYDEFLPDIIIGSNVSSNFDPPNEEDILSQIKNMLVSKTDYSLNCDDGIIIEPITDIGTFDFKKGKDAIKIGYETTLSQLEEIKDRIASTVSTEEITNKRNAFIKSHPPLIFDHINIEGVTIRQSRYVRKSMRIAKDLPPTISEIKPSYFRLFSDDKINYIYPLAQYDKSRGIYDLDLHVKKEKDILLDFGGNFSSRPINTAFIGLKYNQLSGTALSFEGNTYFGKLYSSVFGAVRWDIPGRVPFYVEAQGWLNRWDYFKSSSSFFEDVKPSFLRQNERNIELKIGAPVGQNSRLAFGINNASLTDNYYQTRLFLQSDTTDETNFDSNSLYLLYERGTLNRKMYANKGAKSVIRIRAIEGIEQETPGSTSSSTRNHSKLHQWIQAKLNYINYYKESGNIRLGIFGEGVISTQKLFNNYTASLLRASSFQPTSELKTLFVDKYHSFSYIAFGHRFLINVNNNFELRLAAYLYQPYREILKDDEVGVKLGAEFISRYTILSGALVYHSPLGPASLNLNYYHNISPQQLPSSGIAKNLPVTLMVHFGYILFNKRALD